MATAAAGRDTLFCLDASYRWVTAKVAHGLARTDDDDVRALFADVRARGMKAVPFVWVEGDPIAEARLHSFLCDIHYAPALIVNAESAYEGANAWKSRAYVNEFRALQPDLPLAVSVLGGAAIPEGHTLTPWARPFDVSPWLDAGADFMPQAYWNYRDPKLPPPGSWAHPYRPANCAHTWELAGVPRDRIRLTYGLYENPTPVSPEQYVADTPEGCVGFNSYLLEQYPMPWAYAYLSREVPHA